MADKNTKLGDLPDDLTHDEAAKLFATEIDPVIQALLGSLKLLGFTDEDFELVLEAMKELMEVTMQEPDQSMTVEEGMPLVYVSDLLTLGALACEMYKRQHLIPKAMKTHGHN